MPPASRDAVDDDESRVSRESVANQGSYETQLGRPIGVYG